jgi:hypothetical protein
MRLAAALVLAGCVDSRSAVRGTYSYRYPDGRAVPFDLSATSFQAYVLEGAGFVPYPQEPVLGNADGTFEIADVPDGPYLLRRSAGGFYGVFMPQEEHVFDESRDVLGRADAAAAETEAPLELDATGLAAWQDGDALFVDCFGNASEVVDPELSPPLAAGATAIHATFDWASGSSWGASTDAYLMDPSAGDQLVIAHASAHVEGDLHTWTVTQVLAAPAPSQVAGQLSRVAGAFVDVAPTATLTARVPGDQLAATLEPGVTPVDQGVVVVTGPGTRTGELLGPELARASSTAATAPLTASVAYADPFDPAWPPRVTGWYTANRRLETGRRGPMDIPFTAFAESIPLDGPFVLEPLAPVGGATLDGEAIAGGTHAVPPRHALRLDFAEPPEATRGRVIVWRVDRSYEAAYVVFDRAPVDLPPDIFVDGGRYTFEIDVFVDDARGGQRTASTVTDAVTIVGQ